MMKDDVINQRKICRTKTDNADIKPKYFIDLQSFIWVIGSSEHNKNFKVFNRIIF